jgi:hypothetical protein
MSNWVNLAFESFAMMAALIAIFEGTRRLACDGTTRKRILAVMAGLIWCALLSAFQFYISTADSLKMKPLDATELHADWGKALSPTQREESSRMRASAIYSSTGILVDYIAASTERKKYAPTQDELKQREATVIVNQQLDTMSQGAYANGFHLILFPLFALVVGWAVGREQRDVTANQSLQRGR